MMCENICKMHRSPVNCILHLIAGIILIYGLWTHDWIFIIIGILIMIAGHLIQCSRKETKEIKRPRKRR